MKAVFKKYLWVWEFIGAAIIIGVGFVCRFVPAALYFIVGAIFVIMGLFRVIPLVKTTDDKLLKWLYAIEIVICVIAGGVLIYLAFQDEKDQLKKAFGYIIGGVLYLRGLVYFFSTSLRKDDTELLPFIAHIILFTVGTFIIAKGGFDVTTLGWVILAIAILAAGMIIVAGTKNYKNFRGDVVSKRLTKKIKVESEDKKEAPTSDEIVTPDVDNKINEKEEDKPSVQA